ncbi:PepSY-associated TM helix domain-containing protein [Lacibacter sp. H375]|uniref:PepSY-associated TM helix domain-containing protein n=1 Tax=Lacibacter sp. H375 TaxID=3133424 RepID=UPI0030C01322
MTQKIVKRTRWYRKIHRWIASGLFVFFFFIAGTGLLLGWKKNSHGYLLADSHKGVSTDSKDWLPIDSLQSIAFKIFSDSTHAVNMPTVERIDIRPSKGMVKFVFSENYLAIQLDCTTGSMLHFERRRADFVEHLHDGTILDNLFKNKSGLFKLSYTTIMGVSLLLLTITGFWLWYNPKRIKQKKQ